MNINSLHTDFCSSPIRVKTSSTILQEQSAISVISTPPRRSNTFSPPKQISTPKTELKCRTSSTEKINAGVTKQNLQNPRTPTKLPHSPYILSTPTAKRTLPSSPDSHIFSTAQTAETQPSQYKGEDSPEDVHETQETRSTTNIALLSPTSKKMVSSSFQKHHIIPRSICKEFKGKLKSIRFSQNDPQNITHLPTVRFISDKIANVKTPSSNRTLGERAKTATLHIGRHSNKYSKQIRKSLTNIFSKRATSLETKLYAVRNLTSSTKELLLSGSLQLNNVDQKRIKYVSYTKENKFEYIANYFQVHHIIPQEFFTKDEELLKNCAPLSTFKKAFKFIGFQNQHFLENLSSLPTSSYLPYDIAIAKTPMRGRDSTGRSPHCGSHPNYNKTIKEKLIKIFKILSNKIARIKNRYKIEQAKEQAREKILAFIEEKREELYSNHTKLD